jgi:putative alpha-1,2-mannosidase
LPTTSCHGSFPAASISLEWSVDDFAISQFADALGDSATAGDFQDRAQCWQNLFNPTTHSISPRNALGFFPEGPAVVQPVEGCFSQVGFDEGNGGAQNRDDGLPIGRSKRCRFLLFYLV